MKKKTITIIIAVVLSISALVANALVINPNTTAIRKETITSSKIEKDLDGTLIAYFSDLKYSTANIGIVEKAIDNIKSFKPDVIIFGGDLLAEGYRPGDQKKEEIIALFKELNAPLGKYAVLGDEDQNDTAIDILYQSGFRILDNSSSKIYNGKSYFELVGFNNMVNGNPDIDGAYEGVNGDALVITVTHCPDSFDDLGNHPCDYFLAGHSLGGSIYLPLINMFYRFEGAQKHFHGSDAIGESILDITNGVGLGKQKARLFADSEIVLYKLNSAS